MRSTPQQSPRQPDYERQDCGQTLERGIAEYFETLPGLAQGRGMSAEAAEFFRCHDAVHVVYGCGNGYMQVPLRDIRREFGIRVAHADGPQR